MQTNLATPHWSLTNLPPLIPLEFLAVARRERMANLINACEGHELPHCWDISVEGGKGGARRELRVFYLDVDAVLGNRPVPPLTHAECLRHFIPDSRGLKGRELQALFTCSPDLIHDLDAAGLLQVERERAAAVGPRSSRLYSRESVVRFLESRFMGQLVQN